MQLSYFLLAFIPVLSCVFAATTLGFAVVAPGATSVQVSVGGTSYPLTASITGLPYFNGTVSVSAATVTYKYIVDGTSEAFVRPFPSGRSKTFNDFFQRQNTSQSLVQLGWPFQQKQQWTRAAGGLGVYLDDYISTVFFLGSTSNTFFTNGKKSPSASGLTVAFINKDDVGYFNSNVDVSGKHGDEAKIALNVELASPYHGRSIYKLRPSVFDPVFIREKIYNDILQSIGCPHQETTFARVYVNNKGLGVYHLQEQTGSYDFVVTQFYGRNVPEPLVLGTPLDASTGADFSTDADVYSFQASSGGTNDNIPPLISALANLDIRNDAAIAAFDTNWFSIDHFFRAAIMEYLAGHWDSYWFFTTNFVMYDDTTEGTADTHKYYFVDQDFDQTFGVDLGPPYNTYGDLFTVQPYTVYVNKTWSLEEYDAPHRTMIDRLLSSQTYVNKFEATLKTIVKSVMNPIALGRRMDAVAARIRPDVAWDRGLGANRIRQTTSATQQWTLSDFDDGFNNEVGGNWGFKTFISERANYISGLYNFQFDNPPLDPPSSAATTGSAQPNVVTTGRNVATTGAASPMTTGRNVATTGSVQSNVVTTGAASQTVATTGRNAASTGSIQPNAVTTASSRVNFATTGSAQSNAVTTGRNVATTGAARSNADTTGSVQSNAVTTASSRVNSATTGSARSNAVTTGSSGENVATTGSDQHIVGTTSTTSSDSQTIITTGSAPLGAVTTASAPVRPLTSGSFSFVTTASSASSNTTGNATNSTPVASGSIVSAVPGFLTLAASLMVLLNN